MAKKAFQGFKVGLVYTTAAGDRLAPITAAESGSWWCKRVQVISGHEALLNKAELWNKDGQWVKYPGGIHDVSTEIKADAQAETSAPQKADA